MDDSRRFNLRWFSIIMLLPVLEGIAVFIWLVSIPADAKRQILFGLSPQRLAMLVAALLPALAFGWLFYQSIRHPERPAHWLRSLLSPGPRTGMVILGSLGTLAAWAWLTAQSSGMSEYFLAYYVRLTPLIAYAGFICFQIILFLAFPNFPDQIVHPGLKSRPFLLTLGVFLFILFSMMGFVAWSRVGLTPDDRYWNEAGAPLLLGQIVPALLATLIIHILIDRGYPSRTPSQIYWWVEVIVVIGIWGMSAYLWTTIDISRSLFAPEPFPPNNVVYPYSDAALHDIGAQFALIGQGINNNQYHDKPFYMFFLFFLHLVGGQDYAHVVRLQAACLALIPVMAYFLGRSLHSRSAGMLAAILIALKEYNSIASTLDIQVSNSRLMMTEVPTAFEILLLALVLVLWLKKPLSRMWLALLAGGIAGVSILTRTNTLLLAPVIVLVIAFTFGKKWKLSFVAISTFTFGLLLVIGPWFILNRTAEGKPFIIAKVEAVLETRYSVDPPEELTQTPAPASNPEDKPIEGFPKASQFVPAHFFHNLVGAVLILPTSPYRMDLSTTLSAEYWKINWDGYLSPGQLVHVAINLFFIAAGLAGAWATNRVRGLLPFLLLLTYYLANALGRTSGARYLVPVDWVVLFYFAMGLTQLFSWRYNRAASADFSEPRSPRNAQIIQAAILAGGLLLLGLGPTQMDKFIPRRYPERTDEEILQLALNTGAMQSASLQESDLVAFLDEPDAVILQGRAFYPRFFKTGGFSCLGRPTSESMGAYPKMIIQVIGNKGSKCVVLPMAQSPVSFPNATDVIVLGCRDASINSLVQAAVILLDEELVFQRSPTAAFQCPLPEPVCDSSGNCR